MDYKLKGEFYDIIGDGYTWDVFPFQTNQSEFLDQLDTLITAQIYGQNSIALVISCIVYSKDLDIWSYNILFLEKNLQGIMYVHDPLSVSFRPNKFQSSTEKSFYIIDIIKVTIIFSYAIFMIGKGFYRWRKKSKKLLKFLSESLIMLFLISFTIAY